MKLLESEILTQITSLNSSPLSQESPLKSDNDTGYKHLVDYKPEEWIELVRFAVVDAAKVCESYQDESGKDITHIYSYNKVMSLKDRQGICEILNGTSWRVLAWYFGPDDTRKAGLTNFTYVMRIPMQSTGNEKFSVFIFIKEVVAQPALKRATVSAPLAIQPNQPNALGRSK